MDTTTYNLDNYKNIIVSGYDYKLPETIINIITNLSNELGVTFKENTKTTNSQEENIGENKKYSKKP